MIEIKNLHVQVEGKEILKGIDLKVSAGSVHAIMGPNGAGKSTLSRVLAGDPSYEVIEGEVWFKGQNILELDPEERACLGLFMGFQYPIEIPGITNFQFLHVSYNSLRHAKEKSPLSEEEFADFLEEKMELMDMKKDFLYRNLNEGFSGGEKKRNEILQMAVLNPDLSILDETDSGLDIDAMRIVARGVSQMKREDNALILVTHYQRLLDLIQPDVVHVMLEGKIVRSGGKELAVELEEKGYDWLYASAR